MSEVRRVRLRAPWDGWEARLHLKDLVEGKDWDPAPRFAVIGAARDQWLALGHDDFADDPGSLVASTWVVFLQDDEMRAYVLHTQQQDITSEQDWQRVAETYAYVVLQRYNREREEEE